MAPDPEVPLAQQLRNLGALSTAALRSEWQARFGKPAPSHLSHDLLRRAIAYEVQARAYGGLKPALVRRLQRLSAGQDGDPQRQPARAPSLTPGSRLFREWRGETQVVEVLTDGFAWQGQRFGSLSAIARQITGTRWSGPRFFGLDQQTRTPVEPG